MADQNYIRWFRELGMRDVPLVGGKTASLGELYTQLTPKGILIPNGFAVTADAYRTALDKADAWPTLKRLLKSIPRNNLRALYKNATSARQIVYRATGTNELRAQIATAYHELRKQYGPTSSVAVRSSATAEDLPNASFAGQHDSFVNVRGDDVVFDACRRCFASLFTSRAIVYRNDNNFDHFKVSLSVAVMKMVRSDLASSGVTFTLDTESGFRDVVLITGSYGIGENVVQGRVDPDEFYIHKPTFAKGARAILRHSLGKKQIKLVFSRRATKVTTMERQVAKSYREKFCLTDQEALTLAGNAIEIEAHYSRLNGRSTPIDIEWAKDGADGRIYMVQARPETVASQRKTDSIQTFTLRKSAKSLVSGRAVGERIASGKVRVIANKKHLAAFQKGEILVAETTTPDWQPIMKKAAGIVTNRGGRTCHAAIVAREMGVPAIVGTGNALTKLTTGATVTVSCSQGDIGHVYEGAVPFDVTNVTLSQVPQTKTKVMINLGDPDFAFKCALLPNDGVGLARMEFIINQFIGIHPMALANLDQISNSATRKRIREIIRPFGRPQDYFIQKLSEGVGMIAAAFYPRPVIVRLSDFKTNEYAKLLGGEQFEPVEANPMIGFRGASRYAHPHYAAGFALECAALRHVREIMRLTNLKIMVPFCRREAEGKRVIETMAANGLKRGENDLEIYVMCEIPNNVISIDAFAQLFDGFSIGSNDLTQLTLGVDRDSEIVSFDFDERDPGMIKMLRLAIEGAHRNQRHVGICGEAPANYPELAQMLVEWGIDSISVNPSSVLSTINAVAKAERQRLRKVAN